MGGSDIGHIVLIEQRYGVGKKVWRSRVCSLLGRSRRFLLNSASARLNPRTFTPKAHQITIVASF
jgi:hypothetical protein